MNTFTEKLKQAGEALTKRELLPTGQYEFTIKQAKVGRPRKVISRERILALELDIEGNPVYDQITVEYWRTSEAEEASLKRLASLINAVGLEFDDVITDDQKINPAAFIGKTGEAEIILNQSQKTGKRRNYVDYYVLPIKE